MKQTYLHILFISSLIAVISCNDNAANNASYSSSKPGADTVAVFLLSQKKVIKKIELPAELLPYEQAELSAKVQGYVKEMKVDIGDKVRKGETLAIIEAPEVNTKYAEFQTSLLAAKAKYNASLDNYLRLWKASQANTPGIVAPVDLERNKQQMLADSASYYASEKLAQSYKEVSGYLILKAPFDGIITTRKADPGDLVNQNSVIVTVQNNRILRLRVAVPEIYVSSGNASDTIQFKMDAFPEKIFKAKLTRKTETIDPSTRTELWEYDYNNNEKILKAGAFAYVQLKIEREFPSFVVPFSAVASTQEKKFVIRVKNNKAEWIDVRQGMTLDEGVEIFGNLSLNDTLFFRATDERKPGTIAFWKLK
ncbi:MAG: efflux RND transporter periplasmic adaptor subunit [Bacteroidetes bacterium]|nr:efflux RND transporter periplasmic adaptor subunit [Bacteroidota bacterium]